MQADCWLVVVKVTTEMESYDQNSEAPYQHIWWLDDLYEQSVYFNSPTAGLDQNTTYEVPVSLIIELSLQQLYTK